MRFIKRKRDKRNYEIIRVHATPQRIVLPEVNYVNATPWNESRLRAIAEGTVWS